MTKKRAQEILDYLNSKTPSKERKKEVERVKNELLKVINSNNDSIQG